jgi:hypothetical protein
MPKSKKQAITRVDRAIDHTHHGPVVRVAFAGLIKSIKTMTDAVGDKVGSITIGFRPEGSIVADLDQIHQPDTEIYVVIVEKQE